MCVARQTGITCGTVLRNKDWYTLFKHNSMNELLQIVMEHVTQ